MNQFQLLLHSAQDIKQKRISTKTVLAYKRNIAMYEKEILSIDGAPHPFPINEELSIAFLEMMRKRDVSHAYLMSFVTSFANYCKENKIFDFTKTYEFEKYKEGLMKTMKGGSFPNAKEPMTPKMLIDISELINHADRLQLRDMAMYSMMFYGFLRFSDCSNLKPTDIFTEDDGKLRINIRFSKMDQSGEGENVFIFPTDKPYCAIKWYMKYVRYCETNGVACNFAMVPNTFKRRLDNYLKMINLDHDIKSYAGHSFRRGGAHFAALNGIQDCIIKAHGRWKSAVYTRYTSVQMIEAGSRITIAI